MNSRREELSLMTKEELINHVIRLERSQPPLNSKAKRAMKKQEKVSQITTTRHIALMVMYFGWDYHGMARLGPGDSHATVEGQLISALCQLGLADSDCDLKRCGRTDKGVSAISQVVSLQVRSNLVTDSPRKEFNYTCMLNSVLPPDIRVFAWSPVPDTFDARHSCRSRTYVYFFPAGGCDITEMNSAAQFLVGTHDFNNFCCKSDQENPVTKRTVILAEVTADGEIGQFKIRASGFLYHQVRMIVRCLLFVGRGFEDKKIIPLLLDVDKITERPNYGLAPAFPLVFYDAEYDDLTWTYDSNALERLNSHLLKEKITLDIKGMVVAMAKDVAARRVGDADELDQVATNRLFLTTGGKNYKSMIR